MKEEIENNESTQEEVSPQDLGENNDEKPKVLQKFTSIFKPNIQISDTLINVLTVSFGVLLATFLNHLVSSYNENHEAEQFLKGLNSDLEKDHKELESDLNSFKKTAEAFKYYYNLERKEEINADSIKKHQNSIHNYVLWFPNAGRFEGLKSSGKIYYIKDEVLRNEILDFYQETAPVLIGITNYYNSQSERLRIYIEESNSTKGIEVLLLEPKGKIILLKCLSLQQAIIDMYGKAIHKTENIMEMIEKE